MKNVIWIVSGVVLLVLFAYIATIANTYFREREREESHREKIVGTWYPSVNKREKFSFEFTKDGKLTISPEKEEKIHGTYTITGEEIAVVIMDHGKETGFRLLIKKLTSSELIVENEELGRSFVFHQER